MKPAYRVAALLGLCFLSACGGGSSSTTSTSVPVADYLFSSASANVVLMTVGPGPASAQYQTFNVPFVSVTVCQPGTSNCVTIPDVLVDTGSYGLRVMASVLASAGLSLTPMADPAGNGNTVQECYPFADGYTWGAVSTATVTIGGETTSSAVPVQVIDDNSSGPPVPAACESNGTSAGSVDELDANGVLGVGVFAQDCGSGCVGTANANNEVYFSCPSGGGNTCSSIGLALANQVANPVASFPTDNNGVILQLPSILDSGAPTATGFLVFGIGTEGNTSTESDNALQGANVLTANDEGNFTTTFNGQTLANSFFDSGSNALYFNDSSLATCGSSGDAADFYCPSVETALSATNQGENGNTSGVSFEVANLNNISDNNYAIDDVAGPAAAIPGFGAYFDWGLPFFYGRTIFMAIDGKSAGGTTGPYYAY